MLGHIDEGAIPAVLIKAVGQPRGLADVDVIETVAVEVAGRNAVVAIEVDSACAVEHGAPVIDAEQHLLAVRGVLAQHGGGNVDKSQTGQPGARLGLGGPGENRPVAAFIAPPAQRPLTGPLFAAVRVEAAGKIIVHMRAELQRRFRENLDHVDLNLGKVEMGPGGEIAFKRREEGIASDSGGGRKGGLPRFERGMGAQFLQCRLIERRGFEGLGKPFAHGVVRIACSSTEALRPGNEALFELHCVFFFNELIGAGTNLLKEGLEERRIAGTGVHQAGSGRRGSRCGEKRARKAAGKESAGKASCFGKAATREPHKFLLSDPQRGVQSHLTTQQVPPGASS